MQSAKNMVFRNDRRTILRKKLILSGIVCTFLVSCTGILPAKVPRSERASWSLQEDLDWYKSSIDASKNDYSMIYSFLDSSQGTASFLKRSERIELASSACESWIVYQAINIDAAMSEIHLLCREGDEWRIDNGQGEQKKADLSNNQKLDELMDVSGGDEIIGMPCLPIFGLSVEYLTVSNNGVVTRHSIYAREAERDGCGDAKSASRIATEMEDVSDIVGSD